MKTIKKEIEFGGNGGQKMLHESYESYREFYDTVMSRQANAHRTIEQVFNDHDTYWMGINSIEEAKNMLMNGWEKPLEDLKVKIDKELAAIDRARKQKYFNDVAGFMPIVPNALMGLPRSMINVRFERQGAKILRFIIMIDRGCGNNVETIVKKMSKILAQIASLERSGKYRCRLEVCFTAFGDSKTSKVHTSCSVLVKSENQLFDVKRLCYPIIHPSMLRLLMFAWEESLPIPSYEYRIDGYGRSYEYWGQRYKDSFIKAINENNENIISCDLNTDLEYVLENY